MTKHTLKEKRRSLPPTTRSLPISLIRAQESIMNPIRAMLQNSGITEQQWRVLRVLNEHGPIDATRLSERAGLLPPSVTRIVKSMSNKELLSRRNDPYDRRRQEISLLPKGQGILDENFDQAVAIADGIKTQLGEKDYEQLLDLLDRL